MATQLTITIPEGATSGALLQIPIKAGAQTITTRVPEGLGPGSIMVLTKAEGSDEWIIDSEDVGGPQDQAVVDQASQQVTSQERIVEPLPQISPGLIPEGPVAYTVRMDTTAGIIDIIVRPDWAPHGARRFLELAAAGDLDELAFYRAVKDCMAQFGLPAKRTWPPIPDDPPTGVPFLLGAVCFAAVGPNSRKQTLFICIGDMSHCFGHEAWETPIGAVAESSLDVLENIETCYGDILDCGGEGPDTRRINAEKNAYLRANFPRLTFIRAAWPIDWEASEETRSANGPSSRRISGPTSKPPEQLWNEPTQSLHLPPNKNLQLANAKQSMNENRPVDVPVMISANSNHRSGTAPVTRDVPVELYMQSPPMLLRPSVSSTAMPSGQASYATSYSSASEASVRRMTGEGMQVGSVQLYGGTLGPPQMLPTELMPGMRPYSVPPSQQAAGGFPPASLPPQIYGPGFQPPAQAPLGMSSTGSFVPPPLPNPPAYGSVQPPILPGAGRQGIFQPSGQAPPGMPSAGSFVPPPMPNPPAYGSIQAPQLPPLQLPPLPGLGSLGGGFGGFGAPPGPGLFPGSLGNTAPSVPFGAGTMPGSAPVGAGQLGIGAPIGGVAPGPFGVGSYGPSAPGNATPAAPPPFAPGSFGPGALGPGGLPGLPGGMPGGMPGAFMPGALGNATPGVPPPFAPGALGLGTLGPGGLGPGLPTMPGMLGGMSGPAMGAPPGMPGMGVY